MNQQQRMFINGKRQQTKYILSLTTYT